MIAAATATATVDRRRAAQSPDLGRLLASAEALERHLGDPRDPASPFSFAAAVELDEREAYPEAACAALDRFGLAAFYVPAARGGRLASFAELMALVRGVARRDLTVAIAHHKTLLGAISVWLAGSDEQQARVAALASAGRQLALGLTEREHGSDLLGNELAAAPAAGGYRLSGEKWLINNATRGAALTLYARTGAADGPRAFSLFLVEKEGLAAGSYAHLPKVRTHGVRGADISGIRFDGAEMPASSLVGPLGGGLEITLRGFQVTRTLCAALSLGAGDTALRTALDFALARPMYGATVYAIAHVRETLIDAFVDLLICDCVGLAAARGLHALPEQMSAWSSVAKYLVPATVEAVVHELSLVLGARGYLREGHAWGLFQKLVRDHAIVGLFDGSSVVNLRAVGLQLPQIARRRGRPADPELAGRLHRLLRLDEAPPPLDFGRLTLHGKGRDDLMAELDLALAAATGSTGSNTAFEAAAPELRAPLAARLRELLAARAELDAEATALAGAAPFDDKSPELLDLARRYCYLHAAAACVGVWRHNRGLLGAPLERGDWLLMALGRLLAAAGRPADTAGEEAARAAVEDQLLALHREDFMFSLLPVRLARAEETR